VATEPASLQLRKALVGRLNADGALMARTGGRKVLDFVPERTPMPFVQIRLSERPWDTSSDYGREFDVEFNAWTEAEGRKACELILHGIEQSLRGLSGDALPMDGHRLVNLHLQHVDVFRDGPGQTYCGYQRWRAVTEET